jgi:hypothetical protein
MPSQPMHINKYLPLAILFFFLNSVFLPLGLLYTTLLMPFFLWYLIDGRFLKPVWIFLLVSLLFLPFHFFSGISVLYYLRSYLLLFSCVVFLCSFYLFLNRVRSLGNIFRNLLLLNFALTLVALVFFFIPSLSDVFWYNNEITSGSGNVKRLKMFTYEASYYSLLFAPLAIYFYLQILFLRAKNSGLMFLMVTVPLVLSFSLGVLLGICLTFIFLFFSNVRLLLVNRKIPRYLLLILALIIGASIYMVLYQPDNPIIKRFLNVFSGSDTSFKGRTVDSFYLAWVVAAKKSILFGCGPGQLKLLGPEVFQAYYHYGFTPGNTVIPNAAAETLAAYGIVGLLLRVGLQIWLFFKTRVYSNYYRLALFIFIFIYQFTGSFLTNVAEYVIWGMAFASVIFPEFNKSSLMKAYEEEDRFVEEKNRAA